jgi:two-component system, response regulator PdtaR
VQPSFQLVKNPPEGKGAIAGSGSADKGSAQEKLRLLIVEDDIFIALHLSSLLEDEGHEVVDCAVTAEVAVSKSLDLKPDLVLMDINLAGTRDGISAAVEIWQTLGIKSLFISAFDDPATRARAAQAEPAGYLAKPVSKTALLNAIAGFPGKKN